MGHGQGLDSRVAVEAAVLLEHRLDLSSDNSVQGRPLPQRLLPPRVVPAAGHAQLPAQPAHGEAIHQVVDQAEPLGESCSFAKRAAASLKKFLCPELAVLLAEPVQLVTLSGGDQTLVPGDRRITIDPGLTNPAGQAAGGKAEPMGDCSAGEAFLEAEIGGLLLLERREPAPSLGWVVIDGQSGGHGVTLTDLSTESGEPQPLA